MTGSRLYCKSGDKASLQLFFSVYISAWICKVSHPSVFWLCLAIPRFLCLDQRSFSPFYPLFLHILSPKKISENYLNIQTKNIGKTILEYKMTQESNSCSKKHAIFPWLPWLIVWPLLSKLQGIKIQCLSTNRRFDDGSNPPPWF